MDCHSLESLRLACHLNDARAVIEILSKNEWNLRSAPDGLLTVRYLTIAMILLSKIIGCDSTEVIEHLVNFVKFADPEADAYLVDILELALDTDNLKLAESLLRNGASLQDMANRAGWLEKKLFQLSPLKETLKLLFSYGLLECSEDLDDGLLNVFIIFFMGGEDDENATEIAGLLIDSGVSLDDAGVDGWTPLLQAVFMGNVRMTKYLLQRGADVNGIARNDKRSALMFAAESEVRDNEELAKVLLSAGADINARDKFGMTPLHAMCMTNSLKLIKLLIREGADLGAEDQFGRTPLIALDPDAADYEVCTRALIKELAVLSFEKAPVNELDMDTIMESTATEKYFDECMEELERMAGTMICPPYSYHSVLRTRASKNPGEKSVRALANFMKNKRVVKKVEADLGAFARYEDDLRVAFDQIQRVRNESREVDFKLQLMLGGFLPDVVLRKLAGNLSAEDLP